MGSKRFLSQFLSRDREKRCWPTKLLDDERLYRERILGGLFTVDRRKGTQLEEKDDDNNNKLVYSFHREKEQVTEARFSIPFGRGARFLRQFLTGGRREFSTRRIINSSLSPPGIVSFRVLTFPRGDPECGFIKENRVIYARVHLLLDAPRLILKDGAEEERWSAVSSTGRSRKVKMWWRGYEKWRTGCSMENRNETGIA